MWRVSLLVAEWDNVDNAAKRGDTCREVTVYVIGIEKKVLGPGLVAWDQIGHSHTRRGAVKACTTEQHFYFRSWHVSQKDRVSDVVYPRRIAK